MPNVPIVDATGIKTLTEVYKEFKRKGTKLILSEVDSEQVMQELKKARLLFAIGKANVKKTLGEAIIRSNIILDEMNNK
jgi:SulP family sulfate permease